MDEDVEGMQSTIYYLQQELRKTKQSAANLEAELASLRAAEADPPPKSPTVNGLSGPRGTKQRYPSTEEPADEPSDSPSPSPRQTSADRSSSPRTKDVSGSPDRCVLVNNNSDDRRKRTPCDEANDDVASKKPRADNQLTVRNCDDGDVVMNGAENGGQ